ncbi:MAG: phosphoglycerate mutase family protein, partial [Ethanoligenens sp.]
MDIIFVRHGEPDYDIIHQRKWPVSMVCLAPLSAAGVKQTENAAQNSQLPNADIVVSSPYTRALQTASIISRIGGADKTFRIRTEPEFLFALRSFRENKDKKEHKISWELRAEIKKRVTSSLQRYRDFKKIIVVAHEEVIRSIKGSTDHI